VVGLLWSVRGHIKRNWYEDAKNVCLKMDNDGKAVKVSLQKIIEYCTLTTAAIYKIIPYYWNLK